MSKRKRITKTKSYKKEKAFLLIVFSHFARMTQSGRFPISTNECRTKEDLEVLSIYKWLKNLRPSFATDSVATFKSNRTHKMFEKYYPNDQTATEDDVFIITMLFYLTFLEFIKHNDVKIFIPPINIDETKKILDFYLDGKQIKKSSLLYVYRVALAIDPTKESVLLLKSSLGTLYGDVSFEEITTKGK